MGDVYNDGKLILSADRNTFIEDNPAFEGVDLSKNVGGVPTVIAELGNLRQSFPDETTYQIETRNSGKVNTVPDISADTVISLPTIKAGLRYDFMYGGAAASSYDWNFIPAASGVHFKGGVVWLDEDAGVADGVGVVRSDGNSNDNFRVILPDVGTWVTLLCDGSHWWVGGTVVSTTTPSFADS